MLVKSQININSLVLFTCFVLLCFSWTNFFYVTPLIIPLSFIFLQPYLSLKISRVQLLTTVFFLYSLFSLSLISVHSLFEFNFYRRDGNIFISLMPLITLTFFNFNFDSYKFISRFIYFLTLINLIVYSYFSFNGNLFESSNLYYLGFTSHNAAGGFLAILTSFALITFLYKRTYINFFIFAFNFFTIFESGSRGSYLALIAGIFLFFLLKRKLYKFFVTSVAILFIIQISVIAWGYDQHHKYWLQNDFYGMDVVELPVRNSNNLSHRVIKVWPWAVDDFLESPLMGTGFSSFNDRYKDPSEVLPGIKLRFLKKNIYDSGHAHHSFLNIMAVQGLVGLIIFIFLIFYLFSSMTKLRNFDKDLLTFPLIILILMSLTEHRFAAPSQAFIYFVIYSLVIKNSSSFLTSKDKVI